MAERDPLLRLAARLSHGYTIDWDEEERRAATEEARNGIRKLRLVAAMSVVNRAVISGATREDLAVSISGAKILAGRASALIPGSRWGHLEVLERVGGGSFGDVYRARDPRLDREVALKILVRDASDPRDEVIREARLLAAVRHPSVVMVHGADRIADQVGIWTEFLRGQTLEQILRERGVLDGREAALIGIDLCRALAAVHAAGILHQDVKLSNVMRAEGGRIVLMDFGLGREAEPMRPAEGSQRKLSGTPLFMAPEVMRGDRADARSDLYSLGVVLFSLVTGSLPVEASTLDTLRAKHRRGERRHARDLRPDLSDAFVQVLHRSLSPDPRDRYQSAGDFESALLECLGAPVSAGGAPHSRRSTFVARRDGGDAHGQAPGKARALVTTPHRLPAESDAFIGREAELAELVSRFHGGTRLVTLLGPGGIGKTRLAVRYGWDSLEEWPGGAWFCDLTEASTRDGIASAVGESLGVPLGARDAVEQLGQSIASRGRCLVILDNFEQVVERAAETIVPWLTHAPEARIVVTSRERLNIPGEDVQVIDALPLDRGVELFVERGRRQRPIELDGPEAESVREVVRLVEGIPLAIELSAARLRVMTPGQIVDRIAERFRILAGSGVGRHATLRAAIDGSWEVLKPWEKAAFAQCAVFEGGFSLEAAEGVLDLHAWPDAPWVVDVLQSLVDKSLLRSWISEGALSASRPVVRFGMFVSLQEYARDKLGHEGEIPGGASGPEVLRAVERRHARWFAHFGEEAAIDALEQNNAAERRQALVPELDNLVVACRRMVALGEGATAVQTYRAAWAIIEVRGPFAAAVALGAQVAAMELAPADRGQLLTSVGRAKQLSGDVGQARPDFEACLEIFRDSGDRKAEGRTLANLAILLLAEGCSEEGLASLERALAILRSAGDRRSEGTLLGNIGLAHHDQGRLEEASQPFEEALAIHRELGNRRSEGVILANLGNLRTEQGRFAEARDYLEAALAIAVEVGNRRFEGIVLDHLGRVCKEQQRTAEARAHFIAALAIHREVGTRRFEGQTLDHLAQLSFALGNREEALAHFEAARAIQHAIGNRRSEGAVLGRLTTALLDEGRIDEARRSLAQAEAVLRAPEYRTELGKLLCIRAEIERRTGAMGDARATLTEVESIAAQTAERPDRELELRLASLRQALSE